MKKSLLLLAGVMGVSSLSAQTTDEEQYVKFRDNWSIGINGGIVTPLTHSAFFKNARHNGHRPQQAVVPHLWFDVGKHVEHQHL